jgi:hypothetical protein
MEESGEQYTVVFALAITEQASGAGEGAGGRGAKSTTRKPGPSNRNALCL